MTSFDSSPSLNAWRALLALAVVFVMLATTGWTAVRQHRVTGPREIALAAWEKGRIGNRDLPDAEAPPQLIARFFASLTAVQRGVVAARHPLIVGNLNGAPIPLRYRANRLALAQARKGEERRRHDRELSASGRADAERRVHRYDSLLSGNRQILAFDPSSRGRAAEVFGDLEHAERISVVVPGVDTNLLTLERTHRKYSAPVGMAQSLYVAERAAAPRTRTAVIAWADYTTPVGVGVDSAIGRLAENGAVRLRALLESLPGTSEVSLFCHSYGSVLCGVAADDLPDRVSDIAVAGSPGMRVDHADELDTSARVWAMRDGDDWIEDVPNLEIGGLGHGADPVARGFGARVLSASRAVGHAGYFVPGTDSLDNFARIGVGSYETVTCADGGDSCRT